MQDIAALARTRRCCQGAESSRKQVTLPPLSPLSSPFPSVERPLIVLVGLKSNIFSLRVFSQVSRKPALASRPPAAWGSSGGSSRLYAWLAWVAWLAGWPAGHGPMGPWAHGPMGTMGSWAQWAHGPIILYYSIV